VRTGWYSASIYTGRGSVGRWSGPTDPLPV